MKKPHVEKFLGHDLYVAPLALEQPKTSEVDVLMLSKEKSATIDKYTITFHNFELGGHGEEGMTEAGALLTIAYDGAQEEVRPSLQVTGEDISTTPAAFDNGRGMVSIAGVRPDDGSVRLKVSGEFMPVSPASVSTLVVEVSEKPLINFFWLGTIIAFGAGLWSMRERRRKAAISVSAEDPISPEATAEGPYPSKITA